MTVRSVKAAASRRETPAERKARMDKMIGEVIRENRGALKMLADYDRGLIDRDGNPCYNDGARK